MCPFALLCECVAGVCLCFAPKWHCLPASQRCPLCRCMCLSRSFRSTSRMRFLYSTAMALGGFVSSVGSQSAFKADGNVQQSSHSPFSTCVFHSVLFLLPLLRNPCRPQCACQTGTPQNWLEKGKLSLFPSVFVQMSSGCRLWTS